MNAIGERIRQFRKRAKLTQSELAERVGVHPVTIAKYELGKHQPSVDALERLSDALGVSTDVITGRADKPEEKDEAWEIRERLRKDPNYRTLIVAAGKAKPENLRAATAMLKALEGEQNFA